MKKILLLALFVFLATSLLKAHVSLVYPEGGETFDPGETITIEWEILVTHNTLNWDLYFSNDGGSTWEPIQQDIPYENLTYQWLVPETPTAQGRIRIVQDNEGPDYEDVSGNFVILPPVGIKHLDPENDLKIFPNPAGNSVNISMEGIELTEVRLYSTTGQDVFAIRPKKETFDISTLPQGMYIVEIIAENRKIKQKLLVRR